MKGKCRTSQSLSFKPQPRLYPCTSNRATFEIVSICFGALTPLVPIPCGVPGNPSNTRIWTSTWKDESAPLCSLQTPSTHSRQRAWSECENLLSDLTGPWTPTSSGGEGYLLTDVLFLAPVWQTVPSTCYSEQTASAPLTLLPLCLRLTDIIITICQPCYSKINFPRWPPFVLLLWHAKCLLTSVHAILRTFVISLLSLWLPHEISRLHRISDNIPPHFPRPDISPYPKPSWFHSSSCLTSHCWPLRKIRQLMGTKLSLVGIVYFPIR